MKLTETKDGTVIEVFVKPSQARFKIAVDGDEILVFSTEEPVKGKVNKEIVKELSRFFNSRVELVSGSTSRQKTLLIRGLGKAEAEKLLHEGNNSEL
jgi:uncharacterized protein (TIGR00251 family)